MINYNRKPTKFLLSGLLLVGLLTQGCSQRTNSYFDKKLSFPSLLTSDQKVKLSAYVVPTAEQIEWQQLEMTALVHFGLDTFMETDANADIDVDNWVSTLSNAGFKMLILAVSSNDGFCLWPTRTTDYSVASSPWRNGKGDMVRKLRQACERYNMKFGVYMSPDNISIESNIAPHTRNGIFTQQLIELLTDYGDIHGVWLNAQHDEDDYNKVSAYDWGRLHHVIDSLQPSALKAIMGDDIRWIGNNEGVGMATQWNITPLQPNINKSAVNENIRLNISVASEDLGSRSIISESQSIYWYPSEVNASLRPGLYYSADEDSLVKSLYELVDIYYQSVGMNSVLQLNISPDASGQLHDIDSERLKEFGLYISDTFNDDKLINGNDEWKARSGAVMEFNVEQNEIINTIMLQEDISKGQRVENFIVEGWINEGWVEIAEGTTIGYKRLLKFDDISPARIRVTIKDTRDIANISRIGAFYASPLKSNKLEVEPIETIEKQQ